MDFLSKKKFGRFQEASMTVEASLVLPVFLFAMLLVAYLARLAGYQDKVQWALTRTAREASAEYGAAKRKALTKKAYYYMKFESCMKGNRIPVSLAKSHICEENDEIDLIADYQLKTPFRFLPFAGCPFRAHVHTRAFTGVEDRGALGENTKDYKVYVTEHGRVYHLSLSCPHLKLSISQLLFSDLAAMRNEAGGKYKPCERCCRSSGEVGGRTVWITNFGDRYHISRSCSGLKRSIRTIMHSEVGNRTLCSKCAENAG